MRLAPLLLIVISFQVYGQELKIEKSEKDQKYYLIGKCEDVEREILQIEEKAKLVCQCEGSDCKTELTSSLPKRIKEALNFHQKEFGPNCWNSVLYAKGVHDSFKVSEEMNYFLLSPMCEEVVGAPEAGDIITEYDTRYSGGSPGEPPTFFHNVHSFLSLSDTLAFNKNGPEIEKKYEIVRKEDWYKEFKIKEQCRYTGFENSLKEKCSNILVAYRCSNLKDVKDQWIAFKSHSPNATKLAKKIAADKLKLPRFRDLPASVREKMAPFTQGQDLKYNEQDTKFIYLMASPDMKIPSNLVYRDAILELRRLGLYSKIPTEERLMWISVYFRGANF
jgi:hypothetical protein